MNISDKRIKYLRRQALGKKPFGRPIRGWDNNIKIDFKKQGASVETQLKRYNA